MTKETDDSIDITHSSIPYRAGVGIMLLNKERKVFVAKRIDIKNEFWQMPQGGINPGEVPRVAAMRELMEETCVDNVNVIHESEDWFFYDFPNELASKLWRGRFRGQRQKWFVMEFLGQDSDIDICTERPEFSEWQWTEPESLPEIIVPFKQNLYKALIKEFSHLL